MDILPREQGDKSEVKNKLLQFLKKETKPSNLKEIREKLNQPSQISISDRVSNRLLKEVAWNLVEEGKVQFNSDWQLELTQTPQHNQ